MCNLPIYLTKIKQLEADYLTYNRKLTRKWETVTEEEADRIVQVLHMAKQVLLGADWGKDSAEYWGSELKKWYIVERVK